MLTNKNIEKIKVILDSRIIMYIVPLLSQDNAEIRNIVLSTFLEISKAFIDENLSYMAMDN